MSRFFIEQCQDVFGSKFDEQFIANAINEANLNYGGLNYAGSRVVFVNGNIDPW